MAEKYRRWTPYNYCMDNPMKYTDPDGMDVYYNSSGVKLGEDEQKTHNIRVVNGNKLAKDFYGKNGVINSKAAIGSSKKLSELSNSKEDHKTMNNVISSIYKANFTNNSFFGTYGGLGEDPDSYGDHSNGFVYIDLTNGKYKSDLDDENNLLSILGHERAHATCTNCGRSTEEREARAYLEEVGTKFFQNSTSDFKSGQIQNIAYYLSVLPSNELRNNLKAKFEQKLNVTFQFTYNTNTGYYDYSFKKR